MADDAAPADDTAPAGDATPGDEVDELKHQVADLQAQLAEAGTDSTFRRRSRQVLTGVLVVLTCISLLASVVGYWVRSSVYDTDNWIELVGDLPQNTEVATALSVRLTTELMSALDVQTRIRDVLPERAGILAAPITEGLEGIVQDASYRVITSDQFHELWIGVNRFTHEQLVRLLEGEPGRVSVVDGVVYLNLMPLMGKVLGLVAGVAPDLIGNGQPVPDIGPDTPPDQARAELESYLGRDLPDDFGVIEVFQSDRLAAAQSFFTMFARLVNLLMALTVVLAGVTIFLARSRRLALLELALGAVVTIAAARAIVRNLVEQLIDQIRDPTTSGAIRATIEEVAGTLRGLLTWIVVLGIIVVVLAFLTGPSRPAVWLRHQVALGFGAARSTSESVCVAMASSSLTFTRTFTAFSTFVTELRTVTPIPRRVVVSALCDAVTARCAATASNRAPTRSARWRAPTMESVDSTTVAATTRSGSALARRPVTPRAPSGMASWVNRPASRTGLGGDVSAAADGTAASTVAIAASTAETRFIPAPRRGSCEPVTGTIDQTDQRTGTFAPSHPVAARHSG